MGNEDQHLIFFIISTDCPVKLLVKFQISRDNDINLIFSLSFLLEIYKL